MENLLEFLKTDNFTIGFTISNICLFIVVIVLIIIIANINKKYLKFMKKLGKGNNLEEMLKEYLS